MKRHQLTAFLPNQITASGYCRPLSVLFSFLFLIHSAWSMEAPPVTCPADFSVCINEDPLDLSLLTDFPGAFSGTGVVLDSFFPALAGEGPHTITHNYMVGATPMSCVFVITVDSTFACLDSSRLEWVFLPADTNIGACSSNTNCCEDTLCYGLKYTPASSGTLTSYTTGFFVNCEGGLSPLGTNMSCIMDDNSFQINGCMVNSMILFNSSGNEGAVNVSAGNPLVIHQVCFFVPAGDTLMLMEDPITDLTTSIKVDDTTFITEHPDFETTKFFRVPPVAPVDSFRTVQCAADVVEPDFPIISDMCGNPVIPVLDDVIYSPDPLDCEGTVTYYYTYTDCGGLSVPWTYTYTIDHTIAPHEVGGPVLTSATIACPLQATAPLLPVIVDACGEILSPGLPSLGGTFNLCEGTITITYPYFDCSGIPFFWTFTYTIEREDFMVPANQTVTVACPAATNTPPIPPLVFNNCGTILLPFGPPTVSPQVVCEGNRTYTYRYRDCEGNMHNWVFTYIVERNDFMIPPNDSMVVSCPSSANVAPTPPVVMDNCGTTLAPVQTIISDPVICEGIRTYTYVYQDCEGNMHNWVFTYRVEREEFSTPPSGSATVACPADAEVVPTPPVIMDNCGNVLTPVDTVVSSIPIPCEGNKIYVFTYVDCEGHSHSWAFTYTVERLPFANPVDTFAIVDCPLETNFEPVAYFPLVIDNCGNVLTPGTPVVSAPVSCEGSRTYTYTFTDCELNTQDWTFTYIVERQPFVPPGDVTITVECPATSEIEPTAYFPVVVSDCGETLSPMLVSGGSPVVCEGDRTYTYQYTDCEGNTAQWHFTYHVDRTPFPDPADITVNVPCPSASNTTPTAFLPVVMSNCGETLSPSGPIVSPPVCVGARTYTYTYTDCAGNTQTWVYTYNILPNTSLSIHCPAPLVLNCTAGLNYPSLINAWIATATASDACDANVVITTNYDGVSYPSFTCVGGLNITFTATDNCGNTATCVSTVTKPCFNMETWVYMEGAAVNASGGNTFTLPMRTTLNDLRVLPGQLLVDPFFGNHYSPPGQPYTIAPWFYPGTEGAMFDSGNNPMNASAGYPSTVVDWVLVSLRTDSAGTGGPVCQAAALLNRDGVVQFVKPLTCCGVNENESYYVVIEHRNHLIVMSQTAQPFINHKLSYDFRFQQSYEDPLFAGLNIFARQKEIQPGKFAMFAGNGNQTISSNADTDMNFDDRSYWESQNGQIGSYRIGDYNLNGDTNFNDRIVWERNNGKFTSVPR